MSYHAYIITMLSKLIFTESSFCIPYEEYDHIFIIKSIICRGGKINSAEISCSNHHIDEKYPKPYIVKYFQNKLGLQENTIPTFIYGQRLTGTVFVEFKLESSEENNIPIIEVLISSEKRPPFYEPASIGMPIHNVLLCEKRKLTISNDSYIITFEPNKPDVIFIECGGKNYVFDDGQYANSIMDDFLGKKICIYGYLYYQHYDKGYLTSLRINIW